MFLYYNISICCPIFVCIAYLNICMFSLCSEVSQMEIDNHSPDLLFTWYSKHKHQGTESFYVCHVAMQVKLTWNQSIVQQFTSDGNFLSRLRKASPMGLIARTIWSWSLTRDINKLKRATIDPSVCFALSLCLKGNKQLAWSLTCLRFEDCHEVSENVNSTFVTCS